jgi:hypothetical protein
MRAALAPHHPDLSPKERSILLHTLGIEDPRHREVEIDLGELA